MSFYDSSMVIYDTSTVGFRLWAQRYFRFVSYPHFPDFYVDKQ